MKYFLYLFILCSTIPTFLLGSTHNNIKSKEILIIKPEDIYHQFIYQSVFDTTNHYTEIYNIDYHFDHNIISINNGKKDTIISLKDNFDINEVHYKEAHKHFIIQKKDLIVTYLSNHYSHSFPTQIERLVIFPEFQLRDFLYNDAEEDFEFYYILDPNRQPVPIHAIKSTTNNQPIITLTISGVDQFVWKLVYYYNEYAWITKKEGYFHSDYPRYKSILQQPN